jgi:hypothetical protein
MLIRLLTERPEIIRLVEILPIVMNGHGWPNEKYLRALKDFVFLKDKGGKVMTKRLGPFSIQRSHL